MPKYKRHVFIIGRILKFSIKWACIGHCVTEYIGDVVVTNGKSMEPTLTEGNVLFIDHLVTYFTGIKSGDIVVCRSVTNPKINVCKRVGAVSGEYVFAGQDFYRVPEGHVWLLGDNRDNSIDSRKYGAVPLALVHGRVLCRLWPPDSFRVFTRNPIFK